MYLIRCSCFRFKLPVYSIQPGKLSGCSFLLAELSVIIVWIQLGNASRKSGTMIVRAIERKYRCWGWIDDPFLVVLSCSRVHLSLSQVLWFVSLREHVLRPLHEWQLHDSSRIWGRSVAGPRRCGGASPCSWPRCVNSVRFVGRRNVLTYTGETSYYFYLDLYFPHCCVGARVPQRELGVHSAVGDR